VAWSLSVWPATGLEADVLLERRAELERAVLASSVPSRLVLSEAERSVREALTVEEDQPAESAIQKVLRLQTCLGVKQIADSRR
jgi:hypothetical protein